MYNYGFVFSRDSSKQAYHWLNDYYGISTIMSRRMCGALISISPWWKNFGRNGHDWHFTFPVGKTKRKRQRLGHVSGTNMTCGRLQLLKSRLINVHSHSTPHNAHHWWLPSRLSSLSHPLAALHRSHSDVHIFKGRERWSASHFFLKI
jgi:hypothetical protein